MALLSTPPYSIPGITIDHSSARSAKAFLPDSEQIIVVQIELAV